MPMTASDSPNEPRQPGRIIASKLSLAELVAYRIRKLRTTAHALSRKAGLNPSVISKILSGKQGSLGNDGVERLTRAMGITYEQYHKARRNTRDNRAAADAEK